MCPSEFGRVGGFIFVVLGILGLIQLLGPTSDNSVLGTLWWLDWGELGLYLALGSTLIVASLAPPKQERPIVLLIGWSLVALAAWGFFSNQIFLIHVERPIQPLLYLVMGLWGIIGGFCQEVDERPSGPSL